MNKICFSRRLLTAGVALAILSLFGCGLPEPPKPSNSIPPEYASKHMPDGWWSDHAIIEEGRQIYLGQSQERVNCSKCHGKTGKPVKGGARDLRDTSTMKKFSDSHLLWRIAEGIPFTKMRAHKGKLSEEEMWKVIAYVGTLGMKGLQYDANKDAWIPSS